MKTVTSIIFFLSVLVSSGIAQVQPVNADQFIWHEAQQLILKGKGWHTKNPYERLPVNAQALVSAKVLNLGKYSTGLYVLFTSDTKNLKVKWNVRFGGKQSLMSPQALQGLDLYVKGKEGWRWAGIAKPSGLQNEAVILSGMSSTEREYMLYLPLHDAVDAVFIGVDQHATIKASPEAYQKKPIFFYGTSITQGSAVSRAGMTYPAIIGRSLNRETINLGFSGNGKMDHGIAKLLTETEASFYVVDCLPNMALGDIVSTTKKFVKEIRTKKETPVLLVENIRYTHAWLNETLSALQASKNARLRQAFKELKEEGIKNIYLLDNKNLTKPGDEGAVDGIHLTDLGSAHFAEVLLQEIKKIEKGTT